MISFELVNQITLQGEVELSKSTFVTSIIHLPCLLSWFGHSQKVGKILSKTYQVLIQSTLSLNGHLSETFAWSQPFFSHLTVTKLLVRGTPL